MSDYFKCYPFVAVTGQEQAKRAILITLVNHKAGGLLISGVTGTAKSVLVRGAAELSGDRKLLNLPLNVTEDMLFGSIDLEYAVTRGERRFEPGLLGRADGNIIYIDEVNLLRPELLTAVLDINMAGENRVERDGISFAHKTEYTVIGTMDPHEGVLPNHLLDRFGLFVEAESLKEKEQRKEIMQRLLDFAKDATAFRAKYKEETEQLRARIAKARKLLPKVEIGDAMLELAVQYCSQAFCAGHRADLYLLEAARAIAALTGRTYILPKDMEEAALYVLPHRMRKPPESQPEEQPPQEDPEDMEEPPDTEDDGMDPDDDQEDMTPPPPPEQDNDTENNDEDKPDQEEDNQEPPEQNQQNNSNQEDKVDGIDIHFPFPKMVLDMGKDQIKRKGSGKRSLTKTDLKQGRYVRAELPKEKVNDLAFDATIRAAAPYQRHRPKNGCAINIRQADLRQRVREKRIGTTFLFLVECLRTVIKARHPKYIMVAGGCVAGVIGDNLEAVCRMVEEETKIPVLYTDGSGFMNDAESDPYLLTTKLLIEKFSPLKRTKEKDKTVVLLGEQPINNKAFVNSCINRLFHYFGFQDVLFPIAGMKISEYPMLNRVSLAVAGRGQSNKRKEIYAYTRFFAETLGIPYNLDNLPETPEEVYAYLRKTGDLLEEPLLAERAVEKEKAMIQEMAADCEPVFQKNTCLLAFVFSYDFAMPERIVALLESAGIRISGFILLPEMAGEESQKYRNALQGYGKPVYTEEEYLQEKTQRKTEDFIITIIEKPYFAKQFITTKRHIGAAGICDYWKQLKTFLESDRRMFHEE